MRWLANDEREKRKKVDIKTKNNNKKTDMKILGITKYIKKKRSATSAILTTMRNDFTLTKKEIWANSSKKN